MLRIGLAAKLCYWKACFSSDERFSKNIKPVLKNYLFEFESSLGTSVREAVKTRSHSINYLMNDACVSGGSS